MKYVLLQDSTQWMETQALVWVFKTSVRSMADAASLVPALNKLAGKGRWNFDLQDCDRILRIVASDLTPDRAIYLLRHHGFDCEELED